MFYFFEGLKIENIIKVQIILNDFFSILSNQLDKLKFLPQEIEYQLSEIRKRKVRDSNPRYTFDVHTLSRRAN